MKTNKKHLLTLLLGLAAIIFIIGGCKKELSSSDKATRPDVNMSSEVSGGITKILRQSPGLKIEVKGKTISRVFPKLQGAEKMTSILKEESKKKKPEAITISNATFSATDLTTYYSCETDFPQISGDKDFYLVNMNTWVYTYVGSSSTSYLTFNVNKPSMYGNYRVWTEGNNGSGFSNNIYLGDPYTGVTVSGGLLSFTNSAAYNALKTRLLNAYDTHQTLLDAYNLMSNDNAEAQAIADGFDEFLPFKEFEAYFGFSSLRAKIRGEVEYWQTQSNEFGTGYPEDNYIPYSYEQQTLMNIAGQIEVVGVGEGPLALPLAIGDSRTPSNPGPNTCMDADEYRLTHDYGTDNRKAKTYVFIDPQTPEGGSTTTVFRGRVRTMKRRLGFLWKDKLERSQVEVYGNRYLACSFENFVTSGVKNSAQKLRYSVDADYSAGAGRQSKSGEITTKVTLAEYTSTPFLTTYEH